MSLDISKRRTNIVLTRRGLLEKEMANKEAEAWEQIEVGAILAGKVKNILDFGAFIDLGGIDGLVHLTEISWQKIKHPSDSVNVGQDVHVKVIKMDTENKKISLSIKETKEDPWIKEIEQFEVSQIIKGKVVNLTTYGAFVQISDNVTGLVKIPDLSWDKGVKKPSDILNNGEEVETKVLGIDTQSKKISLGIKQAQGDPWVNAESDFPQDSNHNVKVLRITNFGVFVELRPGLEGLIRKNDLGSKKSTEVKPGITLNAKVIHVDTESRKIDLSVRSLELEGEVQEMEDYMSKDGSSPAKKKPQKQGGSLGSFGSLLDELYSNSKNLKDNE